MNWKISARMWPAVLLLSLALVWAAGAKTIYVDADAAGANNGSSWADAYNFLQDALTDVNLGERPAEIRVAQGIYRPDCFGGDLDAFVANYDGQPNTIWVNDGQGTFTDSGQRLGNETTRDVDLGDLRVLGDTTRAEIEAYLDQIKGEPRPGAVGPAGGGAHTHDGTSEPEGDSGDDEEEMIN